MRHVNGTWNRGSYSPEGLKARQKSIRKVRKLSPSAKKAGHRFEKECLGKGCNNTFFVVESKVEARKYCSKSCLAKNTPRPPQTKAQKKAQSERMKKRYADDPKSNPFYGVTPKNFQGWGKGGFCEELGFSVRSTWERDYLCALKSAGIEFEYEFKRYDLGEGRGTYLPDIRLGNQNIFVEITGWDKPGKLEKRALFQKVYGWPLYVESRRPTPETIADFVSMCKDVMQPNDFGTST